MFQSPQKLNSGLRTSILNKSKVTHSVYMMSEHWYPAWDIYMYPGECLSLDLIAFLPKTCGMRLGKAFVPLLHLHLAVKILPLCPSYSSPFVLQPSVSMCLCLSVCLCVFANAAVLIESLCSMELGWMGSNFWLWHYVTLQRSLNHRSHHLPINILWWLKCSIICPVQYSSP